MAESGGCGRCCCSFIFTSGLTALFMWLSLRTSNPKCIIRSFYLPALNKTLNDPKNTTLFLTLRLENGNKDKGIYYDTVNLTFWLPNVSKPIASTAVPSFYQGHNKKATKPVKVGPPQLNWTAVSNGIYPNGTVHFRVDLATAVRFKIMFWKTKRNRLRAGSDVEVNNSGAKVQKKGIKLSAAPALRHHHDFIIGQILLVAVFLHFW